MVAPSEGLVSTDVWLRCRKKLMANTTFQNGRKAKNTWLAGKVKCGRCGYALMSVGNPSGVQYLRCSKRADNKSCPGCGTLRTREFEQFIYGEMVKKMAQFQTLTGKREKVNPKLTALKVELTHVEDEIEKLLNTLTPASAVLNSTPTPRLRNRTHSGKRCQSKLRPCLRKVCRQSRLSGYRCISTAGKKLTLMTNGR